MKLTRYIHNALIPLSYTKDKDYNFFKDLAPKYSNYKSLFDNLENNFFWTKEKYNSDVFNLNRKYDGVYEFAKYIGSIKSVLSLTNKNTNLNLFEINSDDLVETLIDIVDDLKEPEIPNTIKELFKTFSQKSNILYQNFKQLIPSEILYNQIDSSLLNETLSENDLLFQENENQKRDYMKRMVIWDRQDYRNYISIVLNYKENWLVL
jgi:hypothetical protein